MRNLAGRSAQAARDTTQLIQGTIDRVHHGSDVAKHLDQSFADIHESATAVTRLVQEIATATNEQAHGVDQVNTAVAQMDKVTQENAASAEQAASAAEELTAQARQLDDMVAELLRLTTGASGSSGAEAPRAPVFGPPGRFKTAPVSRLTAGVDEALAVFRPAVFPSPRALPYRVARRREGGGMVLSMASMDSIHNDL